jgi:hypothetical protein
MKASEARKISEAAAREHMKAMFKEQNTRYNEKAILAKKDFPSVSKELRKEIKYHAGAGSNHIRHSIERPGSEDHSGNLYLQALEHLIEARFSRDGYTIDEYTILGNGDKYRNPTRYWALVKISW